MRGFLGVNKKIISIYKEENNCIQVCNKNSQSNCFKYKDIAFLAAL